MILVIGGTGLTGAHLLYYLLQKEAKIRVLKRSSSSVEQVKKIFSYYTKDVTSFFSKLEWIEGDILDFESLLTAMDGVEKVYHVAALVSFDPKDTSSLIEINAVGTANVVNTCLEKKIEKLCYVSSVAVLGRTDNGVFVTENAEWNTENKSSPYAYSKYEAEREVWRGIAEGLKAVIVNPAVILGPGDFNKGSSKLFQTVYQGLRVYTTGTNGYVDVNDVAKAMIWLMNSDISGERFILNAENISYFQLFNQMAEALHVSPPKYKVGKLLSEVAWRYFELVSLVSGKSPFITRYSARTANSEYRYSSEKFSKISGISFTPIEETIENTAKIFLTRNL